MKDIRIVLWCLVVVILCAILSAVARAQTQSSTGSSSSVTVTSITGPLPTGGNVIGHVVLDTSGSTIGAISNSAFSVSNFPALQPISSTQLPAALDGSGLFKIHEQGTALADVSDRAVRLMGHVTVDSVPTTAVTGTFFQGTQPVSIATTVNTDPQDRAARLLGHVTVDTAPTTPVTIASMPTTPVTGTVTDQGTDPAGNKNTLPVVQGAVIVQQIGLPLQLCNPVRTTNCKHN